MSAFEVNFDGLIGPSHNYGGLSDGNLASANNAGDVSNPREGALQGLEKMRLLLRAGVKQGVLPPLPRPDLHLLASAGFLGSDADMIEAAAKTAPALLKAAYSASSMWEANAATISPSADTSDKRLHFTSANLSTMLHRSSEHPDTTSLLHTIFENPDMFGVHAALPMHSSFADEGAANHVRLCEGHGASGVELFVYGRDADESIAGFPARQSRLASESVARGHGIDPARTVFARQSKTAIMAGAFHNDVVCVGTLDTLFFHEHAFEDTRCTLEALRRASEGLFELKPVMVPDAEVPLSDAISSYLFNSQLLQWPGEDRLVLLAPLETQETETTRAFCERMTDGNGPIGRVQYVDVRQSMRNGGGPACLRLRVVMTEAELEAMRLGVMLDEAKIDALQEVVRAHYRDRLAPADLADPAFVEECWTAREALLKVLDLEALA
ncbi:MAG: N-succinylarginine dihydrolase [Hyphomonadaceae bacterium]